MLEIQKPVWNSSRPSDSIVASQEATTMARSSFGGGVVYISGHDKVKNSSLIGRRLTSSSSGILGSNGAGILGSSTRFLEEDGLIGESSMISGCDIRPFFFFTGLFDAGVFNMARLGVTTCVTLLSRWI